MGILPPELYHSFYLILVTLFSYAAISSFDSNIIEENDLEKAIHICIIIVLFLGIRPNSLYFTDSLLYYGLYDKWVGNFSFDWNAQNLIFDNLERLCASLRISPIFHYVCFAALYYGCILVACKKIFPNNITLTFICYCGAFSTYAYCVNGYKAGAAAALFLIAIAYWDNLKISLPFVLLSWGVHHSMQLPVAAYFLTLFYNKPKFYYALWCICAIISLVRISYFQEIFSNLTDEQGSKYLSITAEMDKGYFGKVGFRYDFLLYSAIPLAVGWWSITKLRLEDTFYNWLLNMYLICNSAWLLCMYVPYTNRIAYLSWFMYPFVLLYPFFQDQLGGHRTIFVIRIVSLNLLFTLFMYFIYH